mmetsp:Transcript_13560/g.25089  ORF Transcript_13560/g.25089 Transcript_13560/m.25089 type:complete len:804 (+) Transcript_13560:2090-4501(+)
MNPSDMAATAGSSSPRASETGSMEGSVGDSTSIGKSDADSRRRTETSASTSASALGSAPSRPGSGGTSAASSPAVLPVLHGEERFVHSPAKPAVLPSVSLSQAVVRALSDKSGEKRRTGAVEIEKAIVEKTKDGGGEEFVNTLISLLTVDFTCSVNSSQRKGGLLGLVGIALGLGSSGAPKYLQTLLPPILKCFDDPEVRVRYYACEALYNVAKVVRKHILAYFNPIFHQLCKLFADVDVDVKNGAQLLDRLVKEIVTENCDTFQVDAFIPLLERYLKMTNPYIRQFLIGWILALDAAPRIDMLVHLHKFLEGIFNMLSDGNREIRQHSDTALARFLEEIQANSVEEFDAKSLEAIIGILVSQSGSPQRFNRLTAVTWLSQLVEFFGQRVANMYDGVVGTLLVCLSDEEPEIKAVADTAHEKLLELVRASGEPFGVEKVTVVVTTCLLSRGAPEPLPTRIAALRWISMLLDKFPQQMEEHIESLTPSMLSSLSDSSDELVVLDLDVLARIAHSTSKMDKVIGEVIHLFRHDRVLFDSRGSFIVRKLCVLLEPSTVYLVLATELDKEKDLEFAHLMVQALNLILLTAPELASFRVALKESWRSCSAGGARDVNQSGEAVTRHDEPVFIALFKTWCFDPVATLSLCLLSQSYDLSSKLVPKLANISVTVGFLMEIDKLVQLLESPSFLSLRLELIDSSSTFRPALLKTLYGLLMILPQSGAYNTLWNRLNAASSLHHAIAMGHNAHVASSTHVSQETSAANAHSTVEDDLLEYFTKIQTGIEEDFEKVLHAKSLVRLAANSKDAA